MAPWHLGEDEEGLVVKEIGPHLTVWVLGWFMKEHVVNCVNQPSLLAVSGVFKHHFVFNDSCLNDLISFSLREKSGARASCFVSLKRFSIFGFH